MIVRHADVDTKSEEENFIAVVAQIKSVHMLRGPKLESVSLLDDIIQMSASRCVSHEVCGWFVCCRLYQLTWLSEQGLPLHHCSPQ